MEEEAGTELKTVLAGGIDLGANVIGFDAEGDEPFPWIVDAATKLNGETIEAMLFSLRLKPQAMHKAGPRESSAAQRCKSGCRGGGEGLPCVWRRGLEKWERKSRAERMC
jgi:hypothetical protein